MGGATPQRVCGNARVGWRVTQGRLSRCVSGSCFRCGRGTLAGRHVCDNARVGLHVTPDPRARVALLDGACLATGTAERDNTPQRVCGDARVGWRVTPRTVLTVRDKQ